MLRTLVSFAVAATLVAASPIVSFAQEKSKLIPRQVLFGNPDRAAVRISPDGTKISFLAAVDGVLNVWVAPVNDLEKAKPVTSDKRRGIRQYSWAYTSQHILYLQDEGGNENFNVFAVDVNSGATKNIVDNPKVAARLQGASDKFPDEVLIGMNDRDPRFHDTYRVNIRTGERKLVQENPGQMDGATVGGYMMDDDYKVRFVILVNRDGSEVVKQRTDDGKWTEFEKISFEDSSTTGPLGFDKSGTKAYVQDSRGRNTGAIFLVDLKTGDRQLIAENAKADSGAVLTHPTEKHVQAVAFNHTRNEWAIVDPAIKADLDALRKIADGDFQVTSRTLDDKLWTVAFLMDNGPVRFYLYDKSSRTGKYLFSSMKSLEGLPLVKMHPVVIKSRDGLDLVSYLSIPLSADANQDGKPDRPVPLVLNVHGGPWARDAWGYNPEHQWLANRGYAVLSVNFRGSTGFGKAFINAGNREWAGKMHEDLIDAVNWAVKEGIADKDKVAIYGGSYGGYAALVGMTFTPDTFAAGISVVGPSSIVTLLNTIPPYWEAGQAMFRNRVGDHTTEEGRKFLETRSPLTYVDRIKRPLLIGQGANDPRVKQAESDQIVKAMQAKNIPVTYVLFPDEGHGFARPPNRISFYAVVESFLAQHLGGQVEPVGGDFKGSTIQVPAGVEGVPGIKEAVEAMSQKQN